MVHTKEKPMQIHFGISDSNVKFTTQESSRHANTATPFTLDWQVTDLKLHVITSRESVLNHNYSLG